MKKIIFLGISLIIAFTTCVSNKQSQNIVGTFIEGDFEVRIIYNGIEIVEYKGSKLEINIPSEINGLPVMIIGNSAFTGLKLTNINIPSTVTRIGYGAFAVNDFSDLIIPDNVHFIGDKAFYMCSVLKTVTIGNSVTFIGDKAFQFNYLSKITIGANVELGDDSFDNGFEDAYNRNGKQAGTYIGNGIDILSWVKQ